MSRSRARLVLAITGALAAGACENTSHVSRCDGTRDEEVRVKVAAGCGAAAGEVTLRRIGCVIEVATPTGEPGLPGRGGVAQDERPLRQGGWVIWGEIGEKDDRPASARFRRCTATRVEWRLEIACIDGFGAPVCATTLTE